MTSSHPDFGLTDEQAIAMAILIGAEFYYDELGHGWWVKPRLARHYDKYFITKGQAARAALVSVGAITS
jgi:hypothetical protein